jgi:hypothetical protein
MYKLLPRKQRQICIQHTRHLPVNFRDSIWPLGLIKVQLYILFRKHTSNTCNFYKNRKFEKNARTHAHTHTHSKRLPTDATIAASCSFQAPWILPRCQIKIIKLQYILCFTCFTLLLMYIHQGYWRLVITNNNKRKFYSPDFLLLLSIDS